MKKTACKVWSIVLAIVLVFSVAVLATACNENGTNDNPPNIEQTEPQKVKDGEPFTLTEDGENKSITVADYITANGNTVSVKSSAPEKATATLSGGVITVTPVAAGTATVTVTCGSVTVTFAVTVNVKQVTPPVQKCTVTVEGGEPVQVDKGGTFALPATFTPDNENFEFVSWNIEGEHTLDGNTVTVNGDLTVTAVTRRKAAVKIKNGIALTFTAGDEAQTVTVSEYITTHGNTVSVESSDTEKATATLSDGVVTVTPVAAGTATVTVTCGSVEITFAVTVAAQSPVPSVKDSAVVISEPHDLFKGGYTVDLATNINRADEITGYTVNGQPLTNGEHSYTVSGGNYTDTPTPVTLTVTAAYDGGSLTYTYTVPIKNTTEYRIKNGGFDSGLVDWTKNGEIGNISDKTHYWVGDEENADGYSYNADGKFFSAYEPDDRFESNIGALISSPFTVAQNRVITFKLGGARHDVYVDVVDTADGAILARYGNSAWKERTETEDGTQGEKCGCTLIAYKATLPSGTEGKTVYIRVIDMAASNYGILFCDSFVTYYETAPTEGFTDAVDITDRPATVYEIYNGGFEKDMAGWFVSGGDIGVVTSDICYWNNGHHEAHAGDPAVSKDAKDYGQEETKLFSWWSWNDADSCEVNREGNMGTLTSNMFVLKNNTTVSFMLGGANRNVYLELVNAENGTVIKVFHNDNAEDGKLIRYHYTVTDLAKETLCYFRVVDVAVAGWGCFTADGFKVNLDTAPANSAEAANHLEEYKSMVNGSFESGLDGWTAPGDNALGGVVHKNDDNNQSFDNGNVWYHENDENMDGEKLFTFFINGANKEGGTGIIRSSAFVLQENGIISFRLGAAHNKDVYINVYTASGKLLATFRNNAYTLDTVMVQYHYQFDNAEEVSCYFEVVDNAAGDYGCVVMDDFRVNLNAAPQGAVLGSALTKTERDEQLQQQQ